MTIDAKKIGELILSSLSGATPAAPEIAKAKPTWNGSSPPEPNADPRQVYDAQRGASDPAYLRWAVKSGLYASVKEAERRAKIADGQDRARQAAAARAQRAKERATAEQAEAEAKKKALEAADRRAWDRANS